MTPRRDPRCTCDIVRRAIVPEEHNESCPVVSARTTEWQPIETAPRDGTWFLICRANEGWESYEIGAYDPLFHDRFTEVGAGGLYKKEVVITYEWRGFNNFDRATHWMPLPEPPK